MAARIATLDGVRFAPETVLVLPLGAHEQHGNHLPLDTDTIIAEAVADRLIARLGDGPVLALPAEPVGYSPEHMDWSGTRSLPYAEAIERWCALGARAAAAGCRRMLLLNAHGGNAPLIAICAQELRRRAGMLCVATAWTRHGDPAAIVGEREKLFGIHGGAIETAVMLAVASERVGEGADHRSLQEDLAERFTHLRAYGPHAFGWLMQDLNPAGTVGDARMATAAMGERLLDGAVEGLAELCREMQLFDLDHLRAR